MVGALVGFAVGIAFTEVIFANSANWPDVVPFGVGVVGWLTARELVRRRRSRKPEHRIPSPSG